MAVMLLIDRVLQRPQF